MTFHVKAGRADQFPERAGGAGFLGDWYGLTGDQRLIERGAPFNNIWLSQM